MKKLTIFQTFICNLTAKRMKVLFIGGSGNISSACTNAALDKGIEVFHFNRGKTAYEKIKGLTTIQGDIENVNDRRRLQEQGPFDVVVSFICFTPDQIQRDLELFNGRIKQYVFISSATVYQKPPEHYIVTEDTPLSNPFWKYARDKIACEETLAQLAPENRIKYTIVRPSYTYGERWIPTAFTAREYNPVYRIRRNLPVISHGDGQSLWVMTHNTDFAAAFVGLLGNDKAYNNHFHITSDEVMTWDQIYSTIGEVVGRKPDLIHIPSDFIANMEPDWGAALHGDKACSAVFDNSRIKSLVVGWKAKIPFREGIARSIDWFESKPERMIPNPDVEQRINRIIDRFSNL